MGAVGLRTYIWNNNIRSTLLLIGFPVLLLGMIFVMTLGLVWSHGPAPYDEAGGGAFAYAAGLMIAAAPVALAVAGIWFAIAYIFNQSIIDMATGARVIERAEAPVFYNTLENLCISRGLPMPTPRIIESDGLNAFASGLHPGRFSVTVTRGLVETLDRDELEAVLAHELTHIINRDVRTMVIAAIFAGIITLICQMVFRAVWWSGGRIGRDRDRGGGNLVFWVVAMVAAAVGSFIALLIRMALSRSREYVADAGSVELTKNPDAMISALQKVAGNAHLDAPPSVRAMFLEDDGSGLFGLFATHPPIEKRIAALQRYAGGRFADPPAPAAPRGGPWDEGPSQPLGRPKGPWD